MLYKEFGDFMNLKYNKNDEAILKNEESEAEKIFHLGLISAKKGLDSDSILLHKDKKPRKDVMIKLGKIANEFLFMTDYPVIPGIALKKIINKALGNVDPRVYDDYKKTVLDYSKKDSKFGRLDISFFVQLIPKQFIEHYTTSSSSSFEDLK